MFSIPVAGLALDTILPYFFSQAIGGLSSQNSDVVYSNVVWSIITMLVGVGLNVVGFQTLIKHEANVQFDLASQTFRQLIKKDLAFFINEKIGAMTSRYIDFMRSHVDLQDLLIIRTTGFLLSVITGITIVSFTSPILAIVIVILILVIIIEIKYSTKYRTEYRKARRELSAESKGRVADALTNSLIVKTFSNEDVEIKQIDQINNDYRSAFIKDLRIMAYEGTLRIFVMSIIQITAVIASVTLIDDGSMSIATAIFILVYLQRVSSQLFNLGEMLNGYDRALLDAAPMSKMLQQKTNINDKADAVEITTSTPTIELDNVSYTYDNSKDNAIKNISVSIKAGEKIGLVGHSGSGKTTLSHLMLRFFDVTDGSIKIGQHDIRDIKQTNLRKLIAYVPQEPMLFHRSIRDNISYGHANATEKEIETAIKQANAKEFIDKLPEGIDTIVGERGVKLSGGQRQRIAIARAILKDAPILVLDEATSALDSINEKLIQDALEKLMEKRTSIVIAHRLSTIANMDRVIVMENGKIAEQGTHTDLVKLGGIYAKLWAHQSGGFIEE